MKIKSIEAGRVKYTVGEKTITSIQPVVTENITLWYDVYRNGQRWKRLNANLSVTIITYDKEPVAKEPAPKEPARSFLVPGETIKEWIKELSSGNTTPLLDMVHILEEGK